MKSLQLGDFEIFEGLSAEDRATLESRSRHVHHRPGTEIFGRASSSKDVYFILNGSVRILNYSDSGRQVTFAAVPKGNFFGELAAIDGLPRSASATAIEATDLAVIPANTFLALVRGNPDVALSLIRRLTSIVRDCDQRIFDLSTLGAMNRVYAELLRLAQPDAGVAGQWVVRPYPPEREIATRVNTSRETVARAVSQLRRSGLVKRKGRNLFIMNRDVLQKSITS